MIVFPACAHEIFPESSPSNGRSEVRIGALANRGVDECLKRWTPTAAFLERHLPGTRFRVVPLGFDQVPDAVSSGKVHFIITNPAQYAALEFAGRAYRIASFLVPSPAGPQSNFGGVIFTRSDGGDLRKISDLKGKRFVAVDPESLGGWLCARRELHSAGIDPNRDFAELKFTGTHDEVIKRVLAGSSDAGTIRSSQFEQMAAKGKVDLRNIRVIGGPSPPAAGYPFLLSTRLYPEWPFAVVKGSDETLSRRVAVALLTMEAGEPAAKASGGCGWTIPADYSDVHELLRELRLGPYQNLDRGTLAAIISRYWPHILVTTCAVFLISLFAVKVWILNRRLKGSMSELSQRTMALDAANRYLKEANEGLCREVEARKATEEALRESRELLHAVVEGTSDAVFVTDLNGRFQFCNSAAARNLGKSVQEMLGNDFTALFPEEEARALMEINRSLIAEPRTITYETELTFRGERQVAMTTKGVLREENGNPCGIFGISRNVTAFKKLEAERLEMERKLLHSQKLESLGVLAGGIAHDFNNLLMVILADLELTLLRLPHDSPLRTKLEQAVTACQQAANLVRQMLAYTGKGYFELKIIDLNGIIRENAAFFRTSVARNINLSVTMHPELPFIRGDRGQIQQVIMNLLINASEAIGPAPGEITVVTGIGEFDEEYLKRSRLEEIPPGGTFVYLEVSDTGRGMDPETRARVFEPFFTTKFTGRGLGMSAVLGIVRAHGGAILLDSEAGRGSVFRVLFPVPPERRGDGEERAPLGREAESPAEFSGTVLVVDDEEEVRDLCISMAETLGFQAVGASDGLEALKLFREHAEEISLVILDLMMPNMDGVSAFPMLRRVRRDIDVILSSGYSEEKVSEQFAGDRPAGFIQKPFTVDELREKIIEATGAGRPAGGERLK